MDQRVSFQEHPLEFTFAPAAMKGCTVDMCKVCGIAQACGFDQSLAAAP
jgi:hypothetical protein